MAVIFRFTLSVIVLNLNFHEIILNVIYRYFFYQMILFVSNNNKLIVLFLWRLIRKIIYRNLKFSTITIISL